MAANPQAGPPAGSPPGPQPPKPQGSGIKLGSQSVIGVKIAASAIGVVAFLIYILFLAYTESQFYLVGIIIGAVAIAIGIAGVFIGNMKISTKTNIPTLNIILLALSLILFFIMAVLGSWEDPNTIGESLWNIQTILFVLVFSLLFLCYIELAHASVRFSEIDEYASSHNIKEFSINNVITNYFMWFGILMVIIFFISALVLGLQMLLAPTVRDIAPQLGYSLEYNSIYSVLFSIALFFVPIGIILTFVFHYAFKSHRRIIVKSKEDVVARKPAAVEVE